MSQSILTTCWTLLDDLCVPSPHKDPCWYPKGHHSCWHSHTACSLEQSRGFKCQLWANSHQVVISSTDLTLELFEFTCLLYIATQLCSGRCKLYTSKIELWASPQISPSPLSSQLLPRSLSVIPLSAAEGHR